MKVKSWHISGLVILAIIIGIFVSGGMGATGLGAILLLLLFPSLIYLGWTLHARSLYRNEQLEQRVMDRLRSSDDIVVKRRKARNDA